MIVMTFLIDDTDDDFDDYTHYDDDESLPRFLLIIPRGCWRRQLIKGCLAACADAILQDAD